ncbi:MAG: hypothetical protein ACI4WH_05115 [Oscillospiraceae bacterium]
MALSKIKSFFQNKWTKRFVSIFSLVFAVVMVILSYMSLVYTIKITDFKNFAITIGVFILVLGGIMIYTRKTFLTSLVSMIVFPLFLPIVINCWGNWILIIPLISLAILIFFFCGASENLKTVLGTIYITFFILGTIAYLLYNSLIVSQTMDTKSEYYVSETGTYRCFIIDTIDSSTGSTKVYVEPNTYDKDYNGISFIAKDYEKIVYNIRERKNVKIEWRKDNLFVDNELRFRSSDADENNWFEFLDYKTRITNTVNSTKSICNKVSEKLLHKPLFKMDDEDETENTETPIDDDIQSDTTTTTTPTNEEVTTSPTNGDTSNTNENEVQTTITIDDNFSNDTTDTPSSNDDENIYADYFD